MGSLTQLTDLRERDMAVDLGTTTTLLYVRGRGIMLAQPSVVAVKPGSKDVGAVGMGAERLMEHEAGSIDGVHPVRKGVIADLDLAAEMLRGFRRMVCRSRRAHSRMVVGVPTGASDVDKEALEEVCRSAGATEAYLIEQPIAAAIGAGLPIAEPVGSLVVDIGGGVTEVASIALGKIVAWRSIPVGGDELDGAIIKHLKLEHGLRVSQRTAEKVKCRIGSAFPGGDNTRLEVGGSDARSGLPKTAVLSTEEIRGVIEGHVSKMIDAVKETLGSTPPELSSDIIERGAVLAGGAALLKGLEERLRQETQMPAQVAELPLTCAAAGSGAWLEELSHGRFQEVNESWH